MNKFLDLLTENKYLGPAIAAIITLIAIILAVVISTSNSNEIEEIDNINKEATIVSGEDIEITVINDLEKEMDSIAIKEELLKYITAGQSGLYTLNDKHYVVLTSGGESASDIEYEMRSDIFGNTTIEWKLSDTVNNEYKLRYKILEVSSNNIEIKKSDSNNEAASGMRYLIIFKNGDNKLIYNIADGTVLDGEGILNVDGVYIGEFKDGELSKLTQIGSTTLYNCKIVDLVPSSDLIYNVQIADNTQLQIHLGEDRDLEPGTIVDIKVKFDSVLNTFSGKVLEGDKYAKPWN